MEQSSQTIESDDGRATAWLSEGLESLIRNVASSRAAAADEFDFDIVIVGSGYGGAVALSRLAGFADQGHTLRICMLERGAEYLPGMFPSGFADMAGHVRFDTSASARSRGKLDGLFDVKTGPDVHALVASGLGGGSLINAGVMAWPTDSVFTNPVWPDAIRNDRAQLKPIAESLKKELGAEPAPTELAKVEAMRRLGGGGATGIDITVVREGGANANGVVMNACVGCGDCFTGCNHRAKSSLDVTLLVSGRRKPNVEIFTGATVLSVHKKPNAGWSLEVVHTEGKKRRREKPLLLRTKRVILAAGTFGTTEILMRSSKSGLTLSEQCLGGRFSSNGDSLAEIYDSKFETKAVADELVAPIERKVGPTITTMIDRRRGDHATDFVVQEITVPAAMRRVFEELSVTANSLHLLSEVDKSKQAKDQPARDPNAVDADKTKRSLLVALIGHDDSSGKLVMKEPNGNAGEDGDGKLWVSWPDLRNDKRFADRQRFLEQLTSQGGVDPCLGGRVLANPMWRALPERVSEILDMPLGPQLTVHPLGGCAMAEDARSGVVDHLGRVFNGDKNEVHEGLVVLDGSIIPVSLGINPALTIATLADRAVRLLRDEVWCLSAVGTDSREVPLAFPRPIFRQVSITESVTPQPTEIQVSERLRGTLKLNIGKKIEDYDIEFELWSLPTELKTLMACDGPRCIKFDSRSSEMRVFETSAPDELGIRKKSQALHIMAVEGDLRLLAQHDSTELGRALRAGIVWLRNRGVRDIAQEIIKRFKSAKPKETSTITLLNRLHMFYALATRAGSSRLLEYELNLRPCADPKNLSIPQLIGQVRGNKTISYDYASSPWTQLQRIKLTRFPGWQGDAKKPVLFEFDLTYLQHAKMALIKLVGQQDMPSALLDLGSFALYLLRTVLHVHVWTFRQPDPSPHQPWKRLPGLLPGLPVPQEVVLDLAPPNEKPIRAKLTRYNIGKGSGRTPVILIHGYSASGTTFAHEAIPDGGLAAHLCRKDLDVWVLDLRSSCGMATAGQYWTFEEIGYSDIPVAVEHVLLVTGHSQVDIVAHCMGSAMLAMALLGDYPDEARAAEPHLRERRLLPSRIRRLVMSQVGPALVMAPENVFRAYFMRYVRHYLPLANYRFNTSENAGQGGAFFDRILASIPYPEKEFRLENPLWPLGARTPWVAARHRMDALYGRTFKLTNMPAEVLEHLDDFFGPLNMDTLAQVLHFAKGYAITDARGARFGQIENLENLLSKRMNFKILTLHSGENGLVNRLTAKAMKSFLEASKGDWRIVGPDEDPFPEIGHQDSLIGKDAPKVFKRISEFLEEE